MEEVCARQKNDKVIIDKLLSCTESQLVGQGKENEKMDNHMQDIDDKLSRIAGELERVQEKMYL